jgi:hypothetical protein
MYEPLRFMPVTIGLPKKYVRVVHEGDGKAFEFTEGRGRKKLAAFVKITDDTGVHGQQGSRELENRSLHRNDDEFVFYHSV